MSVDKMTIWVVACFCMLAGSMALVWGPSGLTSGMTLTVCLGHDVNMTWQYNTSSDERIIDVEYRFRRSGQAEVILATYIDGTFMTSSTSGHHITFLPPAGLRLSAVTSQDSGGYVIRVNINQHDSVVSYSRNVTLVVSEPPVVSHNRLQANIVDNVQFDNGTGQWHAILACGNISSLGQPPVQIVVTTPDNQTVIGHHDGSGQFLAILPNPVISGQYLCQLDNHDLCLPSDSPLLHSASVKVDGTKTQLAIVTAELQQVKAASQQCAADKQECAAENLKLQSQLQHCNQAIEDVRDCSELVGQINVSGVHKMHMDNFTTYTAFCDMTTDGGGWTVLLKRQDGSCNFNRSWHDYEDGFGDKNGEYWLGLRYMHLLTEGSGRYQLRVDMSDWDGTSAFALYDVFRVDGPDTNYVLHVTGYHGTAGDDFNGQRSNFTPNNMAFTTYDRDNDRDSSNCASDWSLGWWHNACFSASPTGTYVHNGGVFSAGEMKWKMWHDDRILKTMDMKIRPLP